MRSPVRLAPVALLLDLLLVLSAQGADPPSGGQRETVRPKDTGAALVNPQMGWNLHFYSNIIANYGSRLEPSDTLEDFPGLSDIYLRVPWAFLEPEEGRLDGSLLDTPAQRWIDRGKTISLRISSCESWMRYATPEWVRDAGAKGYDFTPGKGAVEGGVYWEPDYDDPVFLEKLDAFLGRMAARYDGNPNVAFIDIGSYGVWGEGHTWASTKKDWGPETKRLHIDLYLKHFKKTLLAFNDDLAGPDAQGRHHPLADYALSRGVTLRDDSICVQPPPRSWYHAELAQEFWPRLPVIVEHEHFGASRARNAWGDGSLLERAVEEYHASYLSIHWWPREFLEANREVIDRINLRLGYRLQLREASWPKRVRLGEPFAVETLWANAGVAPCYPGGFVAVTLKDAKGGIVSVHVEETTDLRGLPTGPRGEAICQKLSLECAVARTFADGPRRFARAALPGTCGVFVSVGARDGTPRIALPLEAEDGERRYRLGEIELLERAPESEETR